ncbi:E3 ubiquitin-protein ligase march2 [Mactra antiquata]
MEVGLLHWRTVRVHAGPSEAFSDWVRMSRSIYRGQLLQKYYDYNSQSEGLDTVVEEPSDRSYVEPTTDLDASYLDAIYEGKNLTEENNHVLTNSPLCKPKHKLLRRNSFEILNSIDSDMEEIEDDNDQLCYDEPWGQVKTNDQQSTPLKITAGVHKKPQQKVAPLVMQQADKSSHKTLSRFQFSPIHQSTVRCSRSNIICTRYGANHTESVRALPVSPALFTSPTTSTPAVTEADVNTPTCHSIMEHHESVFNFSDCNMCRICHEDGSKEQLVSPCHCSGTMGMLHLTCLGKWLGSSKTTKCEICDFQFIVRKKPHTFRWYMKKSSLVEDRNTMLKDLVVTILSGLLVIIISIVCILFTVRLKEEDKPGPASTLVLIVLCSIIMYMAWTYVAIKRIMLRYRGWQTEHHIIEIEQNNTSDEKTPHTPLQRFSVRLPKTKETSPPNKRPNSNLLSSRFISKSLESYKAAMFNPVPLDEPLLQDINNNDLTTLEINSPSVISLDDIEDFVSYYQPPKYGTTAVLNVESHLLKETVI